MRVIDNGVCVFKKVIKLWNALGLLYGVLIGSEDLAMVVEISGVNEARIDDEIFDEVTIEIFATTKNVSIIFI